MNEFKANLDKIPKLLKPLASADSIVLTGKYEAKIWVNNGTFTITIKVAFVSVEKEIKNFCFNVNSFAAELTSDNNKKINGTFTNDSITIQNECFHSPKETNSSCEKTGMNKQSDRSWQNSSPAATAGGAQ